MSAIKQAAQSRARAVSDSQAKDSGDRIRRVLTRSAPRLDQRWAFGFRFFREIKYFGFDAAEVDKRWILSVLYRLQELCGLPVTKVMESPALRDGTLRIHDIDWSWRNIPIKRSDLDWIDAAYRDNGEEYPLFQVAVSKAEGRLVGFLDEDNVFQIVLLDPLHNAQPSKYNEYKVRLAWPLGCEVTALRHGVGKVIEKSQEQGCGCDVSLQAALDTKRAGSGAAIVMPVVRGTEIEDADLLIREGVVDTYVDIFAAGLVALLEPSSNK